MTHFEAATSGDVMIAFNVFYTPKKINRQTLHGTNLRGHIYCIVLSHCSLQNCCQCKRKSVSDWPGAYITLVPLTSGPQSLVQELVHRKPHDIANFRRHRQSILTLKILNLGRGKPVKHKVPVLPLSPVIPSSPCLLAPNPPKGCCSPAFS